MKKLSFSALVAAGLLAGGIFATSASAADLGGNCCADLEERIAELEATTARKGNRKVSLTISGWVGEQVMWWDDGAESNVYVNGLGTTLASHFKMTGEAQIMPGWSAGYVLHVEVTSVDPFFNNQDTDDSQAVSQGFHTAVNDLGVDPVYAFQSYWFVKSDRLGKVSVGRVSQAADNAAILPDGSGSLVPANWVFFDHSSFFLRAGGGYTYATWGDLGRCFSTGLGIGADCVGVPFNVIRYDSPTFSGFSVSADWGEDDYWDVAARYAGEHHGFKVAGAIAYSQITDENTVIVPGTIGQIGLTPKEVSYFQAGLYIEHVATGLFGYGAYGEEEIDRVTWDDDSTKHWYLKGGLRRKWHPLGHTVLYGEYAKYEDGFTPEYDGLFADIQSSEVQLWGLGLVQEIDAAAMSVWLTYRHYSADATCSTEGEFCLEFGNGSKVNFEDFDLIKFGALINF